MRIVAEVLRQWCFRNMISAYLPTGCHIAIGGDINVVCKHTVVGVAALSLLLLCLLFSTEI